MFEPFYSEDPQFHRGEEEPPSSENFQLTLCFGFQGNECSRVSYSPLVAFWRPLAHSMLTVPLKCGDHALVDQAIDPIVEFILELNARFHDLRSLSRVSCCAFSCASTLSSSDSSGARTRASVSKLYQQPSTLTSSTPPNRSPIPDSISPTRIPPGTSYNPADLTFSHFTFRINSRGPIAALAILVPVLFGAAWKRDDPRRPVSASGMHINTNPADARARDLTADSLILSDVSDRDAFRRWFTFLGEYQAAVPAGELPAEITDCSALLRFAYREALWKHDPAWITVMRLEGAPLLPAVKAYQLPHAAFGARIFRVRPDDGGEAASFAEFADARTLRNLNTHLLGRDIALARPGDLIFYRQLEQHSPFHSMIFVGPSHLSGASAAARDWVVYHTGPMARGRGEIRRVRLAWLMKHPDARWWPVASNPNFLGVYRWNILRDDQ